MLADVASDHVTFWWITLGLGVVVISAVILLLGFLTILVKDIEMSVDEAWEQAGGVATQTATTWMLNETINLSGALRDEVQIHARLLGTAAEGGS